ncbi:MOSC domain-containing protein [Bremerella cremea]|uniref:MOSC domain-containing protein n=1 Tax=Bremerella cremea TaxID=1031537 RepID=A0A368KW48_9BACT|nr:MOSC domain-containing protein [Bremerella cremea]RCS54648.1 MOSC domain-containing protein [Bremerella cremea]
MNLPRGQVVAVCLSNGGIPRTAVAAAVLTPQGFQGDGHRYEQHYARERAVTLFNLELLQRFADDVPSFPPGSVGENITLAGIDLQQLSPGDCLRIGEAEVCLEKRWQPCHAIDAATEATSLNSAGWWGYFASVVTPGMVCCEAEAEVICQASSP